MKISYGIIILAAGESSRLGRPKQLLPFHNTSLVRNIVDAALALPGTASIVITGAAGTAVESELEGRDVYVSFNEEWKTGMSSSIRKGISELKRLQPDIEASIIAVCDQPFVNADILATLIKKHEEEGKGIVASSYSGTAGTPALFSRHYFDELMNLHGQEGAKKLLVKYAADVTLVPFEKGVIDIDTQEDYLKLT